MRSPTAGEPPLGGHPKTGQLGTPQNRPVELIQNNMFLAYLYLPKQAISENSPGATSGHILNEPDGGYGNAGMRPERRQRPEWRGGDNRPVNNHSGPKR